MVHSEVGLRKADEAALVARLLRTPYEAGSDGPGTLDCWGLAREWHRVVTGVVLDERGAIAAGPEGLAQGFGQARRWRQVETPQDGDLVFMRAALGRVSIEHGHCGIWWRGQVLHTSAGQGPALQPWGDRRISTRVTAILRLAEGVA